jgi:hypothetical protein
MHANECTVQGVEEEKDKSTHKSTHRTNKLTHREETNK